MLAVAMLVGAAAGLAAPVAHAAEGGSALSSGGAYELLSKKAAETRDGDRLQGWSYLISGTVALGISLPGYYISDDVFAKGVYSLTETISVASIGYGSYLLLVDNDLTRFVRIVDGAPGIKRADKDRLAEGYLRESADRARNVRWIRVISHGLTAGLNLVNGFTARQEQLQQALYFIGGVNVLAVIGFAFSKSDEEKALEERPKVSGARASLLPEMRLGVGAAGLAWRF